MLITYPTVYVLDLAAEIDGHYSYLQIEKKATLYFPVQVGLHVRFSDHDFLFEIVDVILDHRTGVFRATGSADECFANRAALHKWIEDIGWGDAKIESEIGPNYDSNTKIPPVTGQAR